MIKKENKIVLIILIITIFISLISTSIILSNIYNKKITASVTEVEGYIKLDIEKTLSITILDGDIIFGTCKINKSKNFTILDSNQSINQSDNTNCPEGIFPDSIAIKNVGTTSARIYFNINRNPQYFFEDVNSSLRYFVDNIPGQNGCSGAHPNTYVSLASPATNYLFCNNFKPSDAAQMFLRANLSPHAKGGGSLYFTFVGSII